MADARFGSGWLVNAVLWSATALCALAIHALARCRRFRFVSNTTVVLLYLVVVHAAAAFRAGASDARTVSGMHLVRAVGASCLGVYLQALELCDAWCVCPSIGLLSLCRPCSSHAPCPLRPLILVGVAPVTFLQPLLLVVPNNWEARHPAVFFGAFLLEASVCVVLAALTLWSAHRSGASRRASEALLAQVRTSTGGAGALLFIIEPLPPRSQLEDRVGDSQGLLEAEYAPGEPGYGPPMGVVAFVCVYVYELLTPTHPMRPLALHCAARVMSPH